MESKAAEHVRPALRQRSAKADDTSKQDTTTVLSALQAPGFGVLDRSESLSQIDSAQSSVVSMSGRVQSSLDNEAVPLGRRAGRFRKRKSPAQKHVEDARTQAKKAALLSAQQAGATGNFKSMESEFNNLLIPVIPMQFLTKSKHSGNDLS